MASKKKVAAIGVPVAILLTVIGGMSLSLDFSETNIGQIGDNTFINNYVMENFGVDLSEFKKMCDEGLIPEEAQVYCRLV